MVNVKRIEPKWSGEPCIVAAPGPSLTSEVANACRFKRWLEGWRVIAVQDAYRAMPWADVVYGSCPSWWRYHKDCAGFAGEKWAPHGEIGDFQDDNSEAALKWGVNLVEGLGRDTFSVDPRRIHYGSNSGFQAINLAILLGCTRMVLVGFDMRRVDGKSHFFGEHPQEVGRPIDYERFIVRFGRAAAVLPSHISIVNATPKSALTCFPMMSFDDACESPLRRPHGLPDSHGAIAQT